MHASSQGTAAAEASLLEYRRPWWSLAALTHSPSSMPLQGDSVRSQPPLSILTTHLITVASAIIYGSSIIALALACARLASSGPTSTSCPRKLQQGTNTPAMVQIHVFACSLHPMRTPKPQWPGLIHIQLQTSTMMASAESS